MAAVEASGFVTPSDVRQAFRELRVTWAVDAPLRSVDVSCKIHRRHLHLVVRGSQFCKGALAIDVDPDESCWTIEKVSNACVARQNLVLALVIRGSIRAWPASWMVGAPPGQSCGDVSKSGSVLSEPVAAKGCESSSSESPGQSKIIVGGVGVGARGLECGVLGTKFGCLQQAKAETSIATETILRDRADGSGDRDTVPVNSRASGIVEEESGRCEEGGAARTGTAVVSGRSATTITAFSANPLATGRNTEAGDDVGCSTCAGPIDTGDIGVAGDQRDGAGSTACAMSARHVTSGELASLACRVEGQVADDVRGSFVVGSMSDEGQNRQELVTEQREAESILEPRFLNLLRERGIDDASTLETFFKLFDEKIQLYKLHELERYLCDVVPACRKKGGNFRIRAIQSLAFVHFKMGRAREALELFKELEQLDCGLKNAALMENMAFAHLMLGELDAAERLFREVIKISESESERAHGGALLGLGRVFATRGQFVEAQPFAQRAYDTQKKIAKGRPSSLQAKAGSCLGQVLRALGDVQKAEQLFSEAITLYEITCGMESPLLFSVCNELGSLLLEASRFEDARHVLVRSLKTAMKMDALNPHAMVDIMLSLVMSHTMGVEELDRTELRQYFGTLDSGTVIVRAALKSRAVDTLGGLAFIRLAGETKMWGGDYHGAFALFTELLSLLRSVDHPPPEGGIAYVERAIAFCDACRRGSVQPPLRVSTRGGEWSMVVPPVISDETVANFARTPVQAQKEMFARASKAAASAAKHGATPYAMTCGATLTAVPVLGDALVLSRA
eukprot:TRINITY_DN54567_c0_g1_i1.p1 TRINITY_DN54567_c0_g1~~TRINITY_DN54567_c0_g1_i1.p1  ORF type:complete len:829 (-),score=122.79 TRINITY_DN54567_c0_g1_i1:413-2797(-)